MDSGLVLVIIILGVYTLVSLVMENIISFIVGALSLALVLIAFYGFYTCKAPCTGKACPPGFITHQIVDKCVCLEEAK